MKNYDISVIIPVYNAEKYLAQCIESVLDQTKDNIEIVVVNDGSTDASPEIIRSYAEKNDNIICVDKENGGLASARIAGIQHASGKYIGWVDADDFIKPNMFEELYGLIEKNGADLVYCNLEFYPKKPPHKAIWFKEYHGEKDWKFIERNSQPWHFCMSLELLESIDICSLLYEFEESAWTAVMLHAKKIAYTCESLYYYRVGHESMSGGSYKGKVKKFFHDADTASRLKKIIAGTPYEQTLDEFFDYAYIYRLLLLAIVSAVNHNKLEYMFAKNKLKELNFRKNKYTKLILDTNHGKLKSFAFRYMIPFSYFTANILATLFLH